jgi:hypothetical protein
MNHDDRAIKDDVGLEYNLNCIKLKLSEGPH